MSAYDDGFYDLTEKNSAPSAAAALPAVLALLDVRSVIDVGCGTGVWLAAFLAAGIDDVSGVDGDWVDENRLRIPRDRFQRRDLKQPFALDRRFDLAMSLEVAEHLPGASAPGFVRTLTRLSDVVLFSAAIPGQGGTNHINEQWPDYWARLFAAEGYRCIDCLRIPLWDDPRLEWYYKQNLMLYAAPAALARFPRLAEKAKHGPDMPIALVRPEPYEWALRWAHPGFGRWLKAGKRLLRRKLTGNAN